MAEFPSAVLPQKSVLRAGGHRKEKIETRYIEVRTNHVQVYITCVFPLHRVVVNAGKCRRPGTGTACVSERVGRACVCRVDDPRTVRLGVLPESEQDITENIIKTKSTVSAHLPVFHQKTDSLGLGRHVIIIKKCLFGRRKIEIV